MIGNPEVDFVNLGKEVSSSLEILEKEAVFGKEGLSHSYMARLPSTQQPA